MNHSCGSRLRSTSSEPLIIIISIISYHHTYIIYVFYLIYSQHHGLHKTTKPAQHSASGIWLYVLQAVSEMLQSFGHVLLANFERASCPCLPQWKLRTPAATYRNVLLTCAQRHAGIVAVFNRSCCNPHKQTEKLRNDSRIKKTWANSPNPIHYHSITSIDRYQSRYHPWRLASEIQHAAWTSGRRLGRPEWCCCPGHLRS